MTRSPRSLPRRAAADEPKLRDTYDVLDAAGLRPVLDVELERCLAACPACHGETSDPHGIYRPLIVGCYSRDREAPVRMLCTASGCQPDRIREALNAPPVDWQAIALEYEALAADALAQLDAHLRTDPHLAVAA